MHIGLIGGIGPAATELYYRGLVKAYNNKNKRMSLTIVHADTREMVQNLEKGEIFLQASIFAKYIDQLKAGGAEMVAVTSLGGHFCIKELEAMSALPIINAIPILDAYFGELGIQRIGLLGTKPVMESKLYGGISSVEVVIPKKGEIEEVHRSYINVAISGAANDEQVAFFKLVGSKLYKEQGADVVVLGGTDLFLAFDKKEYDYVVIDSTQIHIDAIARISMSS
ncbi:MAG: aspartate/glutamate racemase family protein [Sphingomonadales bacterium]